LHYFTTNDGLPSNRLTGITEDEKGNLWLGTGLGVSKFDGKTFTNYAEKEGLLNTMVSTVLIDSKGTFWIGTWGGVFTFNGSTFKPFPIPLPTVDTPINKDTLNWVTQITEDSQGNIWIARDGHGASKYNGNTFIHFLKKDGLYSNNVTEIQEDNQGRFWFGTRVAEKDNPDPSKRSGPGGISILNGKEISNFPEIKGINTNDVYEIYRDDADHIWLSTINNGVYTYDGDTFKNYNIPIPIMSITKDKKGNFWLGGAGGLYKINTKGAIINVTQSGPWK
jgi:ligand-binding sensor domain-containing protein